jgi:hypothetical protein
MKKLFSEYRTVTIAIIILILILIGVAIWTLGSGKNTSDSSTNPSAATPKTSQLTLKDLGIKVTLPGSLAGTTSTTSKPEVPANFPYKVPPIVTLQLASYSAMVNTCLSAGTSTSYPYASLEKVSGKAPSTDKKLMKQFDSFYIDRLSAGVNVKCKDSQTQQKLDDLTKSLNDSLQSALTNAKQI